MKKFIIPLLVLPLVVPFHIGNTLSVTGTILSGEKKIIKKPIKVNQTQLTRTQLQRKLATARGDILTLKQKIKIVQARIDRKNRMKLGHSLDDAALQNLMKQYTEAEKMAAELEKKLQDTASGAIQKIG